MKLKREGMLGIEIQRRKDGNSGRNGGNTVCRQTQASQRNKSDKNVKKVSLREGNSIHVSREEKD